MHSLNVLFLNCTLKTSPELSNTEALWALVAPLYQQQGCKIQQQRIADMQILPEATLAAGPGAPFLDVFDRIKQADILVLGTPVVSGMRSSESQKLIERLHGICRTHANPATGQSPLYNKVFGLVLVGDTAGGSPCIAQTCYDFNQLGCINPPNNTVAWFPSLDTTNEGFIEANGKYSVTANRDARLLVDHSVALAKLLRQTPLTVNIREATDQAKAIAAKKPPAIATQATAKAATLITPNAIRTEENLMADGIDYHHLTKRIWIMMQAGMQRGFELTILNLEERIFRAARDGKGFISDEVHLDHVRM
ncbi:MAG: NAD(P)H-dependent oxidoreductase [Cyanobacteria bacterium P01_A01_bin.123]